MLANCFMWNSKQKHNNLIYRSFHQCHSSLFMFLNFRSTIFLGTPKSESFSWCLKKSLWVHKMSYQLVINNFFPWWQVATTLYRFCIKSSLKWSTKRLTFTSTIHSLYQFRLVLPLHKKHPIDLQSKSTGWFLYNGNTANSRHHLFKILILTWLKTFFTTFLKFNLAKLISQKQLKNWQTITIKNFTITRIITKLTFIPPQFTERQYFQHKGL